MKSHASTASDIIIDLPALRNVINCSLVSEKHDLATQDYSLLCAATTSAG